ncbi:hypothetical protein DVR12_19870 [Chitinophaga silvatica]|uniref:Uncharacterized protein n=1 Tax=Chitinophaga silvatica TaxID=2282649 RepID=A0A3E1Y5H9_9BACT|nr:hypothetical protein [Chitinophaga silvatica]RFS19986.1 hypothetical protein DVR12_19870 [Chitinophaga silvatica]
MRQSAYLIRTNRNESEDLFVANNSLPFFWLTLISEKDLERIDNNIQHSSEPPTIRIGRQAAITNGLSSIPFIEECFPDRLRLYQDFISYLDKNLLPDDDMVLDVFSLAPEGGTTHFLQQLKEELQAVEMYDIEKIEGAYTDNDITALIGHGHFPGINVALYEQTFIPIDPLSGEEDKIQDGPSLTAAIVIILAGIIILYVPWQGYKNDDINLAVTCCLIISLSVLLYGCKQLLVAVRHKAIKKTFQP